MTFPEILAVTLPGSSSPDIEYTYDADGVRVSMDDGTVTSYLVDKNRRFAQELEEYDGSMDINVGYVYGDDLISMNRWDGTNPDPSYYLYDALGSTRGLTDDTGTLTDTYDYDPFGTIVDETGSTTNDYLYTGEQYDPGVQFYYLRARYYDPSVGRFAGMDTWGGDAQSPLTLNNYLYADGNPVVFVDPSGHFSLVELQVTRAVAGILSLVALSVYGDNAVKGIMRNGIDDSPSTHWSIEFNSSITMDVPVAEIGRLIMGGVIKNLEDGDWQGIRYEGVGAGFGDPFPVEVSSSHIWSTSSIFETIEPMRMSDFNGLSAGYTIGYQFSVIFGYSKSAISFSNLKDPPLEMDGYELGSPGVSLFASYAGSIEFDNSEMDWNGR